MAQLIIPTPLRKFTNNQKEVTVNNSETAGEALAELVDQYPDIKQHLFDNDGNIRRFVKIYVEDEDITALKGADTTVSEGQTIRIIPAIAGGNYA